MNQFKENFKDSIYTNEELSSLSTEQLKNFLFLRNERTSGSHEDLLIRLYRLRLQTNNLHQKESNRLNIHEKIQFFETYRDEKPVIHTIDDIDDESERNIFLEEEIEEIGNKYFSSKKKKDKIEKIEKNEEVKFEFTDGGLKWNVFDTKRKKLPKKLEKRLMNKVYSSSSSSSSKITNDNDELIKMKKKKKKKLKYKRPSYRKFEIKIVKERYAFLIENNSYYNLQIKFKNHVELNCFKFLFGLSDLKIDDKREGEEGEEEKMSCLNFENFHMEIDQKKLLKILFGKRVILDLDDYIPLFCIFKELKMKNHIVLLLKMIRNISSLEKLCVLLYRSMNLFEKDILENGIGIVDENFLTNYKQADETQYYEFKSVFTANIFEHICVNHSTMKSRSKKYIRFLESLNLYTLLRYYDDKCIMKKTSEYEDVSDLIIVDNDRIHDYKTLFERNVSYVFRSKKFCNVKLRTNDGKEFKVHREVLILNSNFFYQCLKFGGIESSNNKIIKIEILNSVELQNYLDYIYRKQLFSSKLSVLFKLLSHSEMHFEVHLRVFLIRKISDIFFGYLKSGGKEFFEKQFLKNGNLFAMIPESLCNELLSNMKLSKNLELSCITSLNILLDHSLLLWNKENDISQMIKVNKEKDEAIKLLKKKILEQEKTIQNMSMLKNTSITKEKDDNIK